MKTCIVCGLPIAERAKIGLDTCILHGDQAAQREIAEKKNRTGPLFNKGGYQYLGDAKAAKIAALDVGRKTSADVPVEKKPTLGVNYTFDSFKVKKIKPVKLQIGIYWLDGEPHVLYEGETIPKKASRSLLLEKPRPFTVRRH